MSKLADPVPIRVWCSQRWGVGLGVDEREREREKAGRNWVSGVRLMGVAVLAMVMVMVVATPLLIRRRLPLA